MNSKTRDLEEVKKEIAELLHTTELKSKEQALNRRKRRTQNFVIKGIPSCFNGHTVNTRTLGEDISPEYDIVKPIKLIEKLIPDNSICFYTIENPEEIQQELCYYLSSSASSFKTDPDKYKVLVIIIN